MFWRHFSTPLRRCLCTGELQQLSLRSLSTTGARAQQVNSQMLEQLTEEEWTNAKEYKSIPGPSRIGLMRDFLPGGEMYKASFLEMYRILRRRYGDIFVIKGIFGRPDMVCTYNPNDFEVTYRTEGVWPMRVALQSIEHYRKNKNPEMFHGIGGLVTDQGETWADMRNKVNPVMMKVRTVRQALPQIDKISIEFVDRFESLIDPKTGHFRTNFLAEVKMWAFESICYIALNTRLNIINGTATPEALKMEQCMTEFMQYTFDFDIAPSLWKYFETPGFKRLMRVHDDITAITTNYIDKALKRIAAEGNKEAKSVFEKLLRIDRKVAIVMAIDMQLAGMDTSSSVFFTTLYLLARNPEKQEILRKELRGILPEKDTPMTDESTRNLPYMRACIKEALRITPVAPGNMRMLGRNLVLSGYKIPKGTCVHMSNMELCNSDEYFPRSKEFLPERWLKSKKSACPIEGKTQNPFVYLPFGFGPRTCIGKRVAEMEIETLLARILRRYRVTWDGKEEIRYISNLILTPHGDFKFKFEPIKD